METIFDICDTDGSGFIDYHEFLVATQNKSKLITNEKLAVAFRFFDKNSDGKIDLSELREILEGDHNLANE